MLVHQSKNNFFVRDSEALVTGELRVEYCDSCVYLSSTLTSDDSQCLPLSRTTPAQRYLMYSSFFFSFVNTNNDVLSFQNK